LFKKRKEKREREGALSGVSLIRASEKERKKKEENKKKRSIKMVGSPTYIVEREREREQSSTP
jgi:hypothetical protein